MSSAFVKEEDGQWLHDIPPTLPALISYLTRENNGVRVVERNRRKDPKTGREVILMSNGLDYTIDEDSRWSIAW